MSTFDEREAKEDKYTWPVFEKWLNRGEWKYKRFRYPKDITNLNIDAFHLKDDEKIKLKQAFGQIDFDHDGIMMRRGLETWLFDLKYKSATKFKTWVNQKHYDAYYELSKRGIPFIIVVYVHEEDRIYFHKVRNPETKPEPRKFRHKDKYVYELPEPEFILITGFDVPWKVPKEQINYYIWAMKVEEEHEAWRHGVDCVPKPDEYYRKIILDDMNTGIHHPWLVNPLYQLRKKKEKGNGTVDGKTQRPAFPKT